MDPTFIPGPMDSARHIEDSVTKTATYNGASLDLGSGFAPGGIGQVLAAVVGVSAIDIVSGDETYTFVLQESSDNATFTDCGPQIPFTAVAVSTIGNYCIPGFVSKRYIRVRNVVGGTTPSISYTTDFTMPSI